MQLFDNINLGKFSEQLGHFLGNNSNVNANMEICKNAKGKFNQVFNINKNSNIQKNEEDLSQNSENNNHKEKKFKRKNNDKINSFQRPPRDSIIISEIKQFPKGDNNGENLISKKLLNIAFTEENKDHKLNNLRDSSRKIEKRIIKTEEGKCMNNNEHKKRHIIKKKSTSKSGIKSLEKEGKNLVNINDSFLQSLQFVDQTILEEQEFSKDIKRSKMRLKKKKTSDDKKSFRNSNYKILKVYNYGNNINNNYIINSHQHSSRSEDVEIAKKKGNRNLLDIDEFTKKSIEKIKSISKFAETKLVCFRNHSIQFSNDILKIEQIDKKLTFEENKNNQMIYVVDCEKLKEIKSKQINDEEYIMRKSKFKNNKSEEKSYLNIKNNLKVNDRLNDSSLMKNESFEMSQLNILTDENIFNLPRSTTKEIIMIKNIERKIQSDPINEKSNKESKIKVVYDKSGEFENNTQKLTLIDEYEKKKIDDDHVEIVGISVDKKNKYLINHFSKSSKFLKKNVPYVSDYDLSRSGISNKNIYNSFKNTRNNTYFPIKKEGLFDNNSDHKILETVKKEKENKNKNPSKNSIKQERANLKLDYIYSVLKILDKYE